MIPGRRYRAMNEYTVLLTWDDEAGVWYCTSEDIPGLVLESGSIDALVERARHAAGELLALMGHEPSGASLAFRAERHAAVFA
jgi:predicted RNase H-like HicB family nuclease